MPVTTRLIGDKCRVVEPSGRIARNRSGSPLDGAGHDTCSAASAQARAINAGVEKAHETTLVLWARVPDVAGEQLRAAAPFELPDDLHVTILFWPEVLDDLFADVVAISLDLVIRSLPATVATVTGLGHFQTSKHLVALISMPEIERYRSMARAVHEPHPASQFGLVPHMTLGQGRNDVIELPAASWPVTELEVVRAERVLRTISLRG